jgi:hypothetical protein
VAAAVVGPVAVLRATAQGASPEHLGMGRGRSPPGGYELTALDAHTTSRVKEKHMTDPQAPHRDARRPVSTDH